ncbi:PepSY-associated TM helix domain-containing protein [Sphingobacterium siyangense subsp. cladoniae]|uniref:PepSY-associated TM helix domain-containing protein n=1 Tax=Sphingobacterium siyangense TaxID=459529 RepID=UPI0031F7EFF8
MATYTPKLKPRPAAVDQVPKRKGKTLFMRFVSWIHLWPSIVSGLILVFVCLTGVIIVYGDEIMDFCAGDARFVKEVKAQKVTSEVLLASIKKSSPDLAISELVFFKDPKRSVRARVFDGKTKKLAHLYIDPYTAEVLKMDTTIYFFYITAHLHSSLLAGKAGGWIVAISTVIFLISSLTGLILWWPNRWNRTTRQASFTVKWKARFKRLNYDLHNVYGFYSLILCVVLSATGLIIFFHPLGDLTVKLAGGSAAHVVEKIPKAVKGKTELDMVPFVNQLFGNEYASKKNIGIWIYRLEKSGAYVFSGGTSGLKSTENMDIAVFDKYSGARIAVAPPEEIHEKVENYVWQLHMGQWWGQFGKLSTFVAGIVATSLPITGFLIWWGRRKKK